MPAHPVDPKKLTFRETIRDNAFVRQLVKELEAEGKGSGEYLMPIVVVRRGAQLEIIDGHHRAMAAKEAGEKIRAVVVKSDCFDKMKAKGYDDMEISYAALAEQKEGEAADALASQFGLRRRGDEAWDVLEEICP